MRQIIFSLLIAFAFAPLQAQACLEPEMPVGPIAHNETDDPGIIHTAFYDGATDRYAHAVLGDALEGGQLTVITGETETGCGITLTLDQAHVFEDLSPRLVDLTGDGQPEIITIRSHHHEGAQLAIYALVNGSLQLHTATPYIGRAYRWLAPIASADLDGDGHIELAYIDRPHLARTLRVWRYKDGTLTNIAESGGLTNHRIGEAFITGGLRDCGDGPELITADGFWTRIMATRLGANGRLESRSVGDYEGLESVNAALACQG